MEGPPFLIMDSRSLHRLVFHLPGHHPTPLSSTSMFFFRSCNTGFSNPCSLGIGAATPCSPICPPADQLTEPDLFSAPNFAGI